MKTLAYLDCPTGIAGDMCLGALVHAGVPIEYLTQQLARLGIQDEFHLRAETVLRNQQSATKVHVELQAHDHLHPHDRDRAHSHNHAHSHSHSHDHSHAHSHSPHGRHLPEIESLIQKARLPARPTAWSLAIFRRLAEAEAAVHDIPPEQVHFHEVGATDAIVDIVGTCLGLDWLNIDGIVCSPLPTGGGTVWCDHGHLPVPVPAVLSMMASAEIPVYSNGIEKELVTPTGCAIAATLAQSFGPPPRFTLQKIGLGAGGHNLPIPNILRLWIGTVENLPPNASMQSVPSVSTNASNTSTNAPNTATNASNTSESLIAPAISAPNTAHTHASVPEQSPGQKPISETIVELQTQIDDASPQTIGYAFEQLFIAGAVDVFTQAVSMKKNRLGTLLTVLCPESAITACERVLFQETTTLGIRRTIQQRSVLAREIRPVTTAYGEIAIKVARQGNEVLNMQPEYEDCASLARSHQIPWQQIHQAAMTAAITQFMP